MTGDWRSHLNLRTPTDDHFIGWWVRSMLKDASSDRCLYFDFVEGKPKDWDAFISLATSLGKPRMRWIGSPDDAPSREDHDIGTTVVMLKDGVVVITKHSFGEWGVLVGAADEALCAETVKKFKPLLTDERPGAVNMLTRVSGDLNITKVGHIECDLETGNYAGAVASAFDATVADLNNSNPPGRFVLLEGPPGSGKSFWLKALITRAVNAEFLYVPSSLIGAITGPDLYGELALLRNATHRRNGSAAPIVLILEDADHGIVRRAADNFSQLSDLLNLADGIPGEMLDIRIIATTNAKKIDIDPAIVRPGRLARRVEFQLLKADHAQRVYDRLTESRGAVKFTGPVSLADVYAAALSGYVASAGQPSVGLPGFSR